jgi:hypothetical protein
MVRVGAALYGQDALLVLRIATTIQDHQFNNEIKTKEYPDRLPQDAGVDCSNDTSPQNRRRFLVSTAGMLGLSMAGPVFGARYQNRAAENTAQPLFHSSSGETLFAEAGVDQIPKTLRERK